VGNAAAGWQLPEVLRSGNHAEIDKWRAEQSLKRTLDCCPEMLEDN
jgi:tRNA (guanine37-N1)-methyltransferase